ncbi:MAG: aldo/keto reductase [Rhodospirillales bacterium]
MSNDTRHGSNVSRADFLKLLSGAGIALSAGGLLPEAALAAQSLPTRAIPSTGERIPILGLGTSRVFNRAMSAEQRAPLREVIKMYMAAGGNLIDTAPAYGKSEIVLGDLLRDLDATKKAFIATKVRTKGREEGMASLDESLKRLGKSPVDLMQVHSLRDWETQLPILREWKTAGKFRYIGVTHSQNRAHERVEEFLAKENIDFLQINYSILEQGAANRILPMALDRGIAVLINKPFNKAKMFDRVKGTPLPAFAADFDCKSWAQFFLKFSMSHPAVTCVLAATGKPKHLKDNVAAGFGRLPDAKQRQKMISFWETV